MFCVGLTCTVLLAVLGFVRADDQAEGLALIDKAIKAAGGDDKLAKLQSATWKAKGTVEEDNAQVNFAIEGTMQAVDKHRLEVEATFNGRTMKVVLVLNGDKAWAQTNERVEEAPEDAVKLITGVFRALRSSQLLTPFKDKAYKLSPLGEVKVGDRPAMGVKVTHAEQRELDLFFDKETGLLSKCGMRLPDRPGGQDMDWEFLFSEFKDIEGIKHFTTITMQREGKKMFVLEISEVKPQEKVDESLFAKP
jgi:hypothetical protein